MNSPIDQIKERLADDVIKEATAEPWVAVHLTAKTQPLYRAALLEAVKALERIQKTKEQWNADQDIAETSLNSIANLLKR